MTKGSRDRTTNHKAKDECPYWLRLKERKEIKRKADNDKPIQRRLP